MKKLFLIGALLALSVPALAVQKFKREYGVATTIHFEQYDADGLYDDAQADAGTDAQIYCGDATGAATNSDYTANTNGGGYELVLTAAELTCSDTIRIEINETVKERLHIVTYGHPDALDPCPAADCITYGTAQTNTDTSKIILASATSFADGFLQGATVEIVSGTGAGQTRVCSSWTSSTDTCVTSRAWETSAAPTNDSKYVVRHTDFAALSVDANGRVDVGSFGGTTVTANDVGADVDAILADTSTDGVAVSSTGAASVFAYSGEVIISSTADSGTTTTLVDAAALTQADNFFNNSTALIVNFSGGAEVRCIRGFTASTDTVSVVPAFSQAVGTETYTIIAAPTCRNFP